MNVDPTTAIVAIGALAVIASLLGMFIGAFWGLRRVVSDVVRSEFGWLAEWRARIDDERAQSRRDLGEAFSRLRSLETELASCKAGHRE